MDGIIEFTSMSSSQNAKDASDWCYRNPNVRIIGVTSHLLGNTSVLYIAYRVVLEDVPEFADESGALAVTR